MRSSTLVSVLFMIVLLNTGFCDDCSSVSDISECHSTSNFCYIVEANVAYVTKDYRDGVVQNTVNDVQFKFFTPCDQLVTKESCQLGSCLWDPINQNCYEWDDAPCQSYPTAICQWNPTCELVNSSAITLDLATNYTVMNSVDTNQYDGRLNGTWLYEFGVIISVENKQENQETYLFTKCQLKNNCNLIEIYDLTQASNICESTDLNCYFSQESGQCETISHLTTCSDIKWQDQCKKEAAPCIWLSKRCASYDDIEVTCYILGSTKCMNNEECYLDGETCKPYIQCEDFITKEQCDSTVIYNCYYDDYYETCKTLTSDVQCKNIRSEKNCAIFNGKCKWDTTNLICQEVLQDFYCQQYVETSCPDVYDSDTQPCTWNINYQLCVWNYSVDCTQRTSDTCDSSANTNSNVCYLDSVLNICSHIQPNTKCEYLGYYACSQSDIQAQNYCQWSKQRNLCLSIFDMNCEDLQIAFCNYRDKCYKNGNSCSNKKQCFDNTQISDCQDDTTLGCYYDYSLEECRRVTTQTQCNLIIRETSCSQAICAWKNGSCQELENVSCSDLTVQNCKYSSDCYYYDNECIPLDACQINDGNKLLCQYNTHHCYYQSDTNKCVQISANTSCSDIEGAENCNYAHCVLQPGANNKLLCLEYLEADCSRLLQQYCHFGQCTWNSTTTTCVSYPAIQTIVVIDNSTSINQTSTNSTVDNSTVNFAYYMAAVTYLILEFI